MRRSTADRISDALEAMAAAERFAEASAPLFEGDEQALYAVRYAFVVIGEALGHVPDEVRAAHPAVPWRQIVGMRNRIAHDYLGVDRDLVWRTVTEEFPVVRPLLQAALDDLGAQT